jgi:protein-disulfide isomerase
MHFIIGGFIIALAFALQPFALLFAQILLAPTLVPALTGQNTDGSPIVVGKEIKDDDLKIRGNKDAQIFLVEFSDYQCPFCARFHNAPKNIVEKSNGKVAWIWKHYPLPFHPEAKPSAHAAECVYKLAGVEKFWQYSDALIANQQTLSDTVYKTEAGKLGVNGSQFAACLQDKSVEQKIEDQQSEGTTLGVNGTPNTFIVKKVNGKYEILDSINGALPEDTVNQMVQKYLD